MTEKNIKAKEVAILSDEPKTVAVFKPSSELMTRIESMSENLESIEQVTLPKVKMTAGGFQLAEGQNPVLELMGVWIHARKLNMYYEKAYIPGTVEPPTCFSSDGIVPDSSIQKPVNPTCKGCPKAEFGSNSMKKGKACRNLKPVYLLLGDNTFIPRQLAVTPTSIKAANNYLMELTERGVLARHAVTKITARKKNPADTYMVLSFEFVRKLSDQGAVDVEFLRNKWMPAMNNQSIDEREVESEVQTGPKPDPFNPGQTLDDDHVGL